MFNDRIQITIFTDGSCSVKDPYKRGGFGVYCICNGKETTLRRGYWNTTTSRMEMMALLNGIQMVDPDVKTYVTVISDSQFIVNAFRKGHVNSWRRNGWVGIKNSELWKEIVTEIERRRKMVFGMKWIGGHQANLSDDYIFGNNCADALADYKSQDCWEQDLPIADTICKVPEWAMDVF